MKRNVLTVVAAGAIALGGFIVVQAQAGPGGGAHWHGHGFGLQRITEKLDLTSDQETKVQPIIEGAKPQIYAIHQEARQKMKTVMTARCRRSGPCSHLISRKSSMTFRRLIKT
jgi:Spy/CpxP family protein refolding chaperone